MYNVQKNESKASDVIAKRKWAIFQKAAMTRINASFDQ